MFILANLLDAIAWILHLGLFIYMWIIIIRAVLSWVNPDPYNPIVQFLYRGTEPVLQPVRRMLDRLAQMLHVTPTAALGFDFSPLVVIVGILFLDIFFVESLRELAWRLR